MTEGTVDPVEAMGAMMRSALEGVSGAVTAIRESQEAMVAEIRALRPAPAAAGAGEGEGGEPERNVDLLPGSARGVDPSDTMRVRFEQLEYTRADYELAMMVIDGAGKMRNRPVQLVVPDDLRRAWQHHVFELPKRDPHKYGTPIMVREGGDGPNSRLRAMDTAESGNGLDLVGAAYESELWRAARANDPLLGLIRDIPMRFPTDYVPIDGALPELRLLGESTADAATAYTASDTPSSKATLTAKKLGVNQIWSGELEEDSIIQYTPFLREQLARGLQHGVASSFYNGDTTNAGTGNINLDDADPADTKHYLAYNGIRKYWLVTTTAQGKDMAGALDPKEIDRARGKLNGTTDDVDADFNNVNWGADASRLVLVCDFDTYINLLDLDVVTTVDKYGPAATVLTGELGRYKGIRVFAPSYASKTEADGKASDTEASNTKGQITVLNPDGWLAGTRRGMQLYFDRVQRTDQFLFEMYIRKAFTRFGGNVAAGIYDITV